MNFKKVLHFNLLLILIAATSTAMGQDRPAPESAPVIELPEPVAEEEVAPEIEPVADVLPEVAVDTEEPDSDVIQDVIVVTGSETTELINWAERPPIQEGLVILAFDDVSIDETTR